jgi:hypothetical protein
MGPRKPLVVVRLLPGAGAVILGRADGSTGSSASSGVGIFVSGAGSGRVGASITAGAAGASASPPGCGGLGVHPSNSGGRALRVSWRQAARPDLDRSSEPG